MEFPETKNGGDRKSVRHNGELTEDKADRFTKTAANPLKLFGTDPCQRVDFTRCKIAFSGMRRFAHTVESFRDKRVINKRNRQLSRIDSRVVLTHFSERGEVMLQKTGYCIAIVILSAACFWAVGQWY